MKLSVLEQSSLSEGSSAAEAISNTVALAKELDRLMQKHLVAGVSGLIWAGSFLS